MKFTLSKILFISSLCILFANSHAEDHSHANPDNKHVTKLTLNHGKKWASDQPLRQSMQEISRLMTSKISLIHNDKMSDSKFKDLGQKINAQTNNIFKNCKLTPEADGVLHQILIPILKAQNVFLGTDKSLNKHDAALTVINSLKNYGKYFNHEGWGTNE